MAYPSNVCSRHITKRSQHNVIGKIAANGIQLISRLSKTKLEVQFQEITQQTIRLEQKLFLQSQLIFIKKYSENIKIEKLN